MMSTSLSLSVPPHFYGNNYVYCKVRMRAYLMSIHEDVWNIVELGWKRPNMCMTK
jgi:hypothetical protein